MLTSKQRAFLKSLSNNLDTMFQVGKGGLSDNQIREIGILLEKHELVKIHVLENALVDPRTVCDEVVSRIDGCEGVFVIGKRFVIYKQSKENKRIDLVKLCVKEKEEKAPAPKAVKGGSKPNNVRTKKFSFGSKKTNNSGVRGGFGKKRRKTDR